MKTPPTEFAPEEFADRTARAQSLMAVAGLDALLLTTEADLRYFSGFLTRFWQSPTRPWFLIVPASGKPVAVIPSIGRALMESTWLEDIRDWSAPDLCDDGVGLLAETLGEIAGRNGRLGVPMGLESHLRMPLADWSRVQALTPGLAVVSDNQIVRNLRMIKSAAEIGKIRATCAVANRAFARVPEIAAKGIPLDQVFRRFQMLCLEEGADWVPYLAGGAGQGGYIDVISPADPRPLKNGDVLMLDTGVMRDGYFCDFDRNFSLGPPSSKVTSAHARLIQATREAADIARPGATAAELFRAMASILNTSPTGAGRLGHGLGMELTEGLSLIAKDQTKLQPGMVITLEPGLELGDGRIMVHEEDILITNGAPEYLSNPSCAEITVLEG